MLRCRCKHKHTEHEPGGRHACAKAGCACAAFDSPWVCNCNHLWAQHVQRVTEKQVGGDRGLSHGGLVFRWCSAGSLSASPHHCCPACRRAARLQALTLQELAGQGHSSAGGDAQQALVAAGDVACEVNRPDLIARGMAPH